MQASEKRRSLSMSNKMYYHSAHEIGAYCLPQFHTLACHPFCYQAYSFPQKYCTLESSSANGGYAMHDSSSSISLSSNRSPTSQQDSISCPPDTRHSPDNTYASSISGSCITDDANADDFMHKLRELENVMLGPDFDVPDNYERSFLKEKQIASSGFQFMDAIAPRDLKQTLIASAKAVWDGDLLQAQWLMDQLREIVSVSGEPIQRLGAYMLEGLVARLDSSGSSICRALQRKEPESSELLSYMHLLYEVCPYFKFGYMSANGAIAEAMKDEQRVHIIDFQITQGNQWITLIQAFAARPGGPPHIRITGIYDPTSAYARGGSLDIVGKHLYKIAQSFKVPFEFHAVAIPGCDIQLHHLNVRPEEALAVNFAFMLHQMPDESVSTQNHRDRLLRLVKSLSPKVVTLVEQESNTNTAAFYPRFIEAMSYYAAMFESMDVTLPRDHKERINVEQHCLARDVVNIIACEGAERVERHELLGKWRSRFAMAGFTPYPLSSLVNATIKTLLEKYSPNYTLEEKDGALYLGWMKRDLVASCAWK